MTQDHEDGVAPAVCLLCGTPRPDAGSEALTWAREQEPDGRTGWFCPACARHHVRDIEARLAPEWW